MSPSTQQLHRILKDQFNAKVVCQDQSDYLRVAYDQNDIGVWYVMIRNVGDVWEGGEFIIRFTVPEGYPQDKAPKFQFMTPTSLFQDKTSVCVHIGEYHPENNKATLGIIGFANQLASGMIGLDTLGHGIGINAIDKNAIRNCAKQSIAYNKKHHSDILKMFDEFDEIVEEARVKFLNSKKPRIIELALLKKIYLANKSRLEDSAIKYIIDIYKKEKVQINFMDDMDEEPEDSEDSEDPFN